MLRAIRRSRWWFRCLAGVCWLCLPLPPACAADSPPGAFAEVEEVERILVEQLAVITELAHDPAVVEMVAAINQQNQALSFGDIRRLDEQWQKAPGLDALTRPLLSNACAKALRAFQEGHVEFPELFVTDARGLVVGMTNKTSDYYQADEDWWTAAYHEGRGRGFYGQIEYDESAHAEAIALYVPVMDPKTQRAIGVLKAVCVLSAIIQDL